MFHESQEVGQVAFPDPLLVEGQDIALGGGSVAGVILVFDGRRCPLKAGTNAEREARRRSNLAEARRLRALGRMQEARDKYKQCIKATDSMARSVAAGVEKRYKVTGPNHFGALPKVRCVFAPYEADAQLAALARCRRGVARRHLWLLADGRARRLVGGAHILPCDGQGS